MGITLVWSLTTSSAEDRKDQALYREALRAVQKKDWTKASAALDRWLTWRAERYGAQSKEIGAANWYCGEAYAKAGQHAQAIEAFRRSNLKAMLNYYKRNYPRQPYQEDTSPVVKTQMPVLMFHGLKDTALLSDALNNTWDWMGKDLTLVTIPDAGHFVQQDAADMVTRTMRAWLER